MLAIRLLILLVRAYLVFVIISILVSSSRTTRRLQRNGNPLDKGEELVLCLQCQATSLRLKLHAELVRRLERVAQVGDAPKAVAKVLHEHFVKGEEFALPSLGLLSGLAQDKLEENAKSVVRMTDRLKSELSEAPGA
jgi:HAMP domain-containing protein